MGNPYKNLEKFEVSQAMQRRAGELLRPTGTRTREERAALTEDTAFLLLAAALHVYRGEYRDGPLQTIQGGIVGFKDAFLADYEKRKRQERWRTLSEAYDLALDPGLHGHQRTALIGGYDAYEAALSSDEALAETLELLQQHFLARKKKRR
jgi:hypothetical protein